MGLLDKAKAALTGHEEQAGQGVDKAGDMLDEKTGGKYAEHVDKGQTFVKDQIAGEPATEQTPPAP